jgi:hypothetical protein
VQRRRERSLHVASILALRGGEHVALGPHFRPRLERDIGSRGSTVLLGVAVRKVPGTTAVPRARQGTRSPLSGAGRAAVLGRIAR